MFLTIIASLDEKFVAERTYLLHFSLLLLHFLGLYHPIATFSRAIAQFFVAIAKVSMHIFIFYDRFKGRICSKLYLVATFFVLAKEIFVAVTP